MKTKGQMKTKHVSYVVTGEGWMDMQYGDSLEGATKEIQQRRKDNRYGKQILVRITEEVIQDDQ